MANGRRISSGASKNAAGTGKQARRSSQRPIGAGAGGRLRADPDGGIDGGDFAAFTGIRSLLNPLWCYHGFIVAVLVLCCFGVIMVFSSSSVTLVSAGQSPWNRAIKQGLYCVIGLALAFVASRMRPKFFEKFSPIIMLAALGLQALTLTPLGTGGEETGNNGWIVLGPIQLQPAEMTKLALCLWLPFALQRASKRFSREGIRAYMMPGLIFALSLGLILLGKDLGTGMIVVFIGVVAFMVAGFPFKWMAVFTGVLAAGVIGLAITSPNRMNRILAAYKPCTDLEGVCWQSMHAKYALAEGGLLGVGLGNSREKWNYLPEAHTDFIYAIIGEETGFVGALTVLLLFVVIGWSLICVALQIRERYVAMSLICIAVWIVGQALVNIGVVIGIFPVLGVPMPFVSSGGSSMIMCLGAAGAAVGMMRCQPQIKAERVAL